MWIDDFLFDSPFEDWTQVFSPMGVSFSEARVCWRFFDPKKSVVVLSSSNKEDTEVYVEQCKQKNIEILRRRGGGGTVVLTPGCLILSLSFMARELYNNKRYFELINQLWIDAVHKATGINLNLGGISDICYQDKKVAGTSLFRTKNRVVYQGSLLIKPDFELIDCLLQHPSNEPEYRKKRAHRDFLISLHELGCQLSTQQLALFCDNYFTKNLFLTLENDFLRSPQGC